jgi:uncharacterized protein YbjQ (UPF0145 family)
MIVVSTDFVPGYRVVESLGLVRGSTIRAKHAELLAYGTAVKLMREG